MIRKKLIATFLIAFTPLLNAQEWPKSYQPTPSKNLILKQETKADQYHYETKTYRIQSEIDLTQQDLTDFATSAEAVAHAIQALPLPLFAPPTKEKPLIQIAQNETSYEVMGGSKGTAGYYHGRHQKVIIQWEQLNRPTTPKGRPSFDLLVHETCHLCMHKWVWKMEPWLIEGSAEYLAAAHLAKGRYDFKNIDNHIRDRIRQHTRAIGSKVTTLKLETLLQMSSRDWHHQLATFNHEQVLRAYTASLLLTHYAFHGGQERRQQVKDHLTSLDQFTDYRKKAPQLFNIEDAPKIQKLLKTYWKSKGLDLTFQ